LRRRLVRLRSRPQNQPISHRQLTRMHCSNCGTYIAPGVRFCSGCGSPANDPEATRIARVQGGVPERSGESEDLEHTIFTVPPTLIFIKLGYALAVMGAIGLVFRLAMIPVPASISILLAPAVRSRP